MEVTAFTTSLDREKELKGLIIFLIFFLQFIHFIFLNYRFFKLFFINLICIYFSKALGATKISHSTNLESLAKEVKNYDVVLNTLFLENQPE